MCTSSASSLRWRRWAVLARRTKCSWYPATLASSTRHCTEIGHTRRCRLMKAYFVGPANFNLGNSTAYA